MTDSFDHHLTQLLRVATRISNASSGVTSNPVWVTWTVKFLQAYNAAKNPPAYHEMFIRYLNEGGVDLASPIMTDDGRVQDSWLRDSKTTKSKDGSWSLSGIQPRGQVIYFSPDPKYKTVSIPITEIYLAAMKLYHDNRNKDTFAAVAPSSILYNLYGIYAAILPSSAPERSTIIKNKDAMQGAIEMSGVSDVNSITSQPGGGALKDVKSLMRTVIERTGFEIPAEDAEKMEKTVSTLVEGDILSHITRVVGSATSGGSGTDSAGNPDIGAILANVGQALQNTQVKTAISEISAQSQKQSESLLSSIPTEKK